ncbi:MAG: MaoC family dehydratase N-terminal domain-containing protein [Colwellia sp.]|uniref:MaoC family dehydratase N-terminal domain-containing protein n=1 Tax=Colwellia sp. TaxID=56799 RepID=UPI001D50EEF8|nr:MaoC family dehydratase N-terminal domain-containing protein [Colwellia sp.]NQY48135.1 MaoC family dehydratase N-terminal domain-containing protein [Colwellia sp.]
MLDRSKVGHEFDSFNVDIEKGRLKFFAEAIGETNPVYFSETAAHDAGYKAMLAAPTFPFPLDMEGPELLPVLNFLSMDISRLLHGSQEFEYLGMIYAGDNITVTSKIKDMFDKKSGALEFVVLESTYTNQNGDLVARAINSLVYRNPSV